MNADQDGHVEPGAAPRRTGAGLLALAVVQVCFGLFPVFGSVAMRPGAFDPGAVAFWRVLAGGGALFVIAFAVHGRAALPALSHLPRLLLCAALGVAVNQWLYLEGLARSTGLNAALLMCLIPVFTYSIALGLRTESVDFRRAAGMSLALAGAAPLLLVRGASLVDHRAGNLLLAANALAYSFYLVLAKPLLERLPALVVVAWVYLLSWPALPWFAAGTALAPPFERHRVEWLALAWVLTFPTVVAYLLNGVALARVSASTTALAILVQPFIAAAAAWAWLGEQPSGIVLPCAALLLVGLALVASARRGSAGSVDLRQGERAAGVEGVAAEVEERARVRDVDPATRE